MKRSEIFFGIIKIPSDFLMTILGFFVAYQLRLITEPIKGLTKPIDYSVLPTINEYLNFSFQAALALIIIFALGKMYTLKTTSKFSDEVKKSILFWIIWAMAIITYFFFTRSFPFSRLAILYSWGLALVFIILGRSLIDIVQILSLKYGIGKRKLAFIGNNNITITIEKFLKKNPSYKIMGIIGEENSKNQLRILGNLKDFQNILKNNHIDEIIQTTSTITETQEIIEFCQLNHINYRFIPDLLEMRRSNISTETLRGIPVITLKPTPLDGWGKIIKRIMDIFLSILGFIVLSPIFLASAIAIKLDSKGSIIFSKLEDGSPAKRVGQFGKKFTFYKFRSMQADSHSLRYKDLAKQNTRNDGPLVKIKDDPRITKVGKFLRKYDIDELPQLWNVLKGDMSLVGPRPHLPEEVANYQKHHRFVLTIKSGLTGLAQISGRSDLDFEQEVKLDRYYIENWSIFLDLKIIFKTIFIVLRGHQE